MDQRSSAPLGLRGSLSAVGQGRGALGGWAYAKDLRADTRLQAPFTHVFNPCSFSTL